MRREAGVHPTERWAVREIAKNLRNADRRELHATRGADVNVTEALFDCVEKSVWTRVGFYKDEPICILGVGRGLQDDHGCPWMLGTKGIEEIPKTFLKLSKLMMQKMHEDFPILSNFVLKANTVHVNYLRHLGFEFLDEYVINGETFIHFTRYQPHV